MLEHQGELMTVQAAADRLAVSRWMIYRRPDGRWETKFFVDTPVHRRKRISVYVNSEREAINELNKLRDQQRRTARSA